MGQPLRILFVEDVPADYELATIALKRENLDFTSLRVDTREDFLRALDEFDPDIIISDYALPTFNGMEALQLTRKYRAEIPFILLTGSVNESAAVECMKAGAINYVLKNHLHQLSFAVKDAILRQQIRLEKVESERNLRESEGIYRALFHNNHAIMLLIDPTSGQIIDANPAACTYYGWSHDEITHKRISEINTLTEQEVKQEMQNAVAERRNHFLFQHRLASGEIRDVEVFSGPICYKGKTLLYSIIHDITAQKQAEFNLQRKIRLQEMIASLGRHLTGNLDLEDIYQITWQHLQNMIQCAEFRISLLDDHKGNLSVVFNITHGVRALPEKIPSIHHSSFSSNEGRWKAITSRKPFLTHSKSAQDSAFSEDDKDHYKSALFVPILAGQEVLGLLEFRSDREDAFEPEDGEWLGVVASQLGMALQTARHFTRAQQRVAELQVLHKIDLAITTGTEMSTTYQEVLKEIATQPYVDAVDILIFEPENNLLTCVSALGFLTPIIYETRLQLGQGLAGKVAVDRHFMLISGPPEEIPGVIRPPLWDQEGFIGYLGLPLILHNELKGVLEIFSRKAIPVNPPWLHFMEAVARQVAIAVDNVRLFYGLQQANVELLRAYDATIAGWSQAMDLRDKETEGHTERVTSLTLQIAKALGINDEKLIHIRRGALLHDIGKLGVPDSILHKAGPLNDEEWKIMKMHPVFAYEMLSPIEYLRPAIAIPYCHHEQWDGSGYPRGLKGHQIPLEARIFTVVDVYDALTSDRPYRKAWDQERTLAYIQELSGKQFDPKVVAAFLAIRHRLNF